MDADKLNLHLLLPLFISLLFLVVCLTKNTKFYGSTKIWTLLFHLAFAAIWVVPLFLPSKPQVLAGVYLLLPAILLTTALYLSLESVNSKKIKTIWKIPLIGALVGLYIDPRWVQPIALAILFAILLLVFSSRSKLYLILKPTIMAFLSYFIFVIILESGGHLIIAACFGLISYMSAVKILNMAVIKEWVSHLENN